MKIINIRFPENYIEKLKQEKKDTGVPISEIIRRSLGEHFQKNKKLKSK